MPIVSTNIYFSKLQPSDGRDTCSTDGQGSGGGGGGQHKSKWSAAGGTVIPRGTHHMGGLYSTDIWGGVNISEI